MNDLDLAQVRRPKLLDLYCGAGGAGMGYHRAGFAVFGVDNRPEPNYPFEFGQWDALDYLAEYAWDFDAIHASPPCQDHSAAKGFPGVNSHGTGWLLAATREALQATGKPWVIENVPGAPMRTDYVLCGCQFGLPRLRRERWFETSWGGFQLQQPCQHDGWALTVAGHSPSSRDKKMLAAEGITTGQGAIQAWREAMGVDWMTTREMAQAIPPAYTQHIGADLLQTVGALS